MSKYKDKTRKELILELEQIHKSYEGLLNTIGLNSGNSDLSTIKEYQSRMKYLISAARIAWWETNLTDNSVSFDVRKAEMLGFPPDKFKHDQDFTNLLHPDDSTQALLAMKNILEGKQDRYDTEYRLRSASGDYIWFRDVGSVIEKRLDGTPLRIAGIVIDITERKNAEGDLKLWSEQLQETNAEKDKFFSIIAHDLKSPLNSFLGFTELMMTDVDGMSPEDIREMAKLMNASAYNLYRLLDNLLEWSRLKRRMISVEPVLLFLSDEVKDAVNHFSAAATKKQITLKAHVDDKMTVYVDQNMLRSVLRNLINNALKFTHREGLIEIFAIKDDRNFVVTEVKDNGIGMSQVILENLFRIDVDTKRPGTEDEPTTGLGLILCKDFIETNGGMVWATSEEGKGSSVYFSLPASSEPKES